VYSGGPIRDLTLPQRKRVAIIVLGGLVTTAIRGCEFARIIKLAVRSPLLGRLMFNDRFSSPDLPVCLITDLVTRRQYPIGYLNAMRVP
jgi:hypothetical protein